RCRLAGISRSEFGATQDMQPLNWDSGKRTLGEKAGNAMVGKIVIRPAGVSEREYLEALQTRAALSNPRDREALLANPDAIELPVSQIEAGQVFVAEQDGTVAGFAAILRRSDGDAELDGLFVEPSRWRQGIGRRLVDHCAVVARSAQSAALHVIGNPQ